RSLGSPSAESQYPGGLKPPKEDRPCLDGVEGVFGKRHGARRGCGLRIDHRGLDHVEFLLRAGQVRASIGGIKNESRKVVEAAPSGEPGEVHVHDRAVDLESDDPREAVSPCRERIAPAARADYRRACAAL